MRLFTPDRTTNRNPFRMLLLHCTMTLLAVFGMATGSVRAADYAIELQVVNQSGYSDDQVYFIMTCSEPTGYLDFENHVLVETPSWSFDADTMTATLADIKEYSGDNTYTIRCPAMGSSRIYFAFGQNFDKMGGGFASSGPVMGPANTVRWAMFELNLQSGKFLNQSNVDFFSVPYTLTAVKTGSGTVTVGINSPAETIFEQFQAISLSDSSQQSGNTEMFKALIVTNSAGEAIRVVSPKSAAYGDISYDETLPQKFTHFLDDYVNNQCWKPGRTFSFACKLGTNYYAKVSDDGLTLNIYEDEAMTIPCAVSSLPRPSNSWGSPDFAANPGIWHNVGRASTSPSDIDWGYLLYGQDGYGDGPGAWWATNPVAMAIPVSIVRGVMHLDNGPVDWKDSTKYYQGLNGVSTADYPIFYYGKILHEYGIAGHVYALSFDDVYGSDSGIPFTDPDVTLTFYPFAATSSGERNPVYRFYSYGAPDSTYTHLWTINETEKAALLTWPSWEYEGIAWYGLTNSASGTTPLYRLYEPNIRRHLYTINPTEYVALESSTWNGEGVQYYVYPTNSVTGLAPAYRFYNSAQQVHHFTIDENEKDTIIATPSWGYSYEGIGYYVFATNEASSVRASMPEGSAFRVRRSGLVGRKKMHLSAVVHQAGGTKEENTQKEDQYSAGYCRRSVPRRKRADPGEENMTSVSTLSTANCPLPTDLIEVPGDYNGDGIKDTAWYGESTGNWYVPDENGRFEISDLTSQIPSSSPHSLRSTNYTLLQWGGPGFTPVAGDYDGDGYSDLAVYHEETGTWFIISTRSKLILWNDQWGGPGMVPVGGDSDGDGASDLAVQDTQTGSLHVRTVDGRLVQ